MHSYIFRVQHAADLFQHGPRFISTVEDVHEAARNRRKTSSSSRYPRYNETHLCVGVCVPDDVVWLASLNELVLQISRLHTIEAPLVETLDHWTGDFGRRDLVHKRRNRFGDVAIPSTNVKQRAANALFAAKQLLDLRAREHEHLTTCSSTNPMNTTHRPATGAYEYSTLLTTKHPVYIRERVKCSEDSRRDGFQDPPTCAALSHPFVRLPNKEVSLRSASRHDPHETPTYECIKQHLPPGKSASRRRSLIAQMRVAKRDRYRKRSAFVSATECTAPTYTHTQVRKAHSFVTLTP